MGIKFASLVVGVETAKLNPQILFFAHAHNV